MPLPFSPTASDHAPMPLVEEQVYLVNSQVASDHAPALSETAPTPSANALIPFDSA